MESKKRIVLAYSGGLDTSIILKWLQEKYDAEIICYTADIGQEINQKKIVSNAKKLGVNKIIINDLKNIFVKEYVFPMIRGHAIYEGVYLLGTSIARPLIAKDQIKIAKKYKAYAVSHGATGKGNDQVRFELGYYANNSSIEIIAPWRNWNLNSRNDLINFAKKYQIPFSKDNKGEPPFSTDANLLHTSSEGKILEDPWMESPEYVYTRTASPLNAPDNFEEVIISFDKGDPVAINNKKFKAHAILSKLNLIAEKHGVGRIDIVENRFVGIKSRGVYETPGGTILFHAHRAIESITLDKGEAHIKDELMPKYAEMIYNGFWFSSERLALQKIIDETQKNVSGDVRLKVYKGNVMVTGRKSLKTLYNTSLVSFDEKGNYDQKDAEGFIKINSIRLKNKI